MLISLMCISIAGKARSEWCLFPDDEFTFDSDFHHDYFMK